MTLFVDEVEVRVQAGDGGHGLIAFLREKYRPDGGPCGGDGGKGGSVVAVVDRNLHTLLDFRNRPLFKAPRGQHGQGTNRTGRSGEDLTLRVPPGTEIHDAATGEFLGDLLEDGERLVLARGGNGGWGNQRFATAKQRAPHRANDGQEGERRRLKLTLKLIGDVGLVGFPNAGKSTLLSRVSAARPKIADYPFTTLDPQLGIVRAGEYASFVMADIPGLIEGAAAGKGLGHQFLRHIERTRVLCFMIDCLDPEPDRTLRTLEAELASHSPALSGKRRLVVLSKSDLLAPGASGPAEPPGRSRLDEPVRLISAHAGSGLDGLVRDLWKLVQADRAEENEAGSPRTEP